MRATVTVALAAATIISVPLGAQGRGRNVDGGPPGQRPPPGMCRVWIAGVPPGRQPGITDCITARASAPANSRVIYGGNGQHASTSTHTTNGGIFDRRVNDQNGNPVIQRVRRNPDGTFTIFGTRYPNGTVRNGRQVRHDQADDDNENDDDRRGGRAHGDDRREEDGRAGVNGGNGRGKGRGKP